MCTTRKLTLDCAVYMDGHNHTSLGKPRLLFLCLTVPLRLRTKVATENRDRYVCTSGLAQGLTLTGFISFPCW